MRIVVHSITVRATVIPDQGETNPLEPVNKTFTPGEKNQAGWIDDMFSLATRYLVHNAGVKGDSQIAPMKEQL